MENTDNIWQVYSKTKDPNLKEELILEYAHLVKYVAARLNTHVGQHVEFEDLVGYGVFGLIDAIDKFDYEKGFKFETYASLRIRGAMIDGIRKLDWVPRTLRQKSKMLETAYKELEAELGREPEESEIAEKLNISIEETQNLIKKTSLVTLTSLDDYLEQNREINFSDSLSSKSDAPETKILKQELKQILVEAIEKLSDKEKKVVTLYYFEDLTLKEISHIMEVSESRISQIHSKAVFKLQNKLGKYKSILFTT